MSYSITPRFQIKKKKVKSYTRTVFEFVFFLVWLICTGMAGYYVGYQPSSIDCPRSEPLPIKQNIKKDCSSSSPINVGTIPPLHKEDGYTLDELKSMWHCSHAVANDSDINKDIFPEDMDMQKTKWKSILTVEPKAFFDKYLTQYPGDIRAVQPVVVFSHKPLKHFNEMTEVCKVLDIAVVPDKPGVCVAVTETYHDVASYHMLHADRQKDGSFALTGNSVEGRDLPSDSAYAAARALLIDFFKYQEYVTKVSIVLE